MIRKLFRYGLIGILIGSLTYLAILIMQGTTTVTPQNIISIWIMSLFIGWISMIFEYDLNILLEIVIHFVVTLALVIAMTSYNGWLSVLSKHSWNNLFTFVIIYLFIWLGIYLNQMVAAKKLTKLVKIRNKKNDLH
ncbi:DUF3021 domain-containing protein [Companilactobacillus bobalius]|uniref:DUF3021 domain-containing protein n=2 Tax=Companilactobacillus bobalius TaxID=2801451 RepID=A0A202FDK6_9LACO|nr:DUF3021 domain-containing protein [Companilactobacillus bobalius]KAE9556898.1 hypothetical protein ATN92_16605 [Companilactobacillus bobalius]KRK81812.1 hypothetical protein FC78_GL000111 [Companilactobacillus bobalius DSM 19674]OVE98543.1 hypothetical protein LKACC16343_00699 [Companilactobacillus bobalius]GEO59558.1 hypothetical protein LBO01_26870 [Companilactobacillus paralimentarius]